MSFLTQEVVAWMRAADTAGAKLPPSITEACARVDSIQAQIAELGTPERVPSQAVLVANGTALDKAGAEHARLTAAAEQHEETRRVALQAREIAMQALNRLVTRHRDELILSIRPMVTAMIDECRPAAEALEPFAPGYKAEDIVRRADAKQIKAFQKVAEMETTFGALVAAWRASFKGAKNKPGAFDVREVEVEHWHWDAPERVGNTALNGQRFSRSGAQSRIEPSILSVSAEPAEAGFRLATIGELTSVFVSEHAAAVEAEKARQPWRRMRAL